MRFDLQHAHGIPIRISEIGDLREAIAARILADWSPPGLEGSRHPLAEHILLSRRTPSSSTLASGTESCCTSRYSVEQSSGDLLKSPQYTSPWGDDL